MPIILADAEKDYLTCLSNRLSNAIPGSQLKLCTQTEEINSMISKSPDPVLLIYNPADFADFRTSEEDTCRKIECWSLINGNKSSAADQLTFRRIGPTAELVSQLRQWIDNSAGHRDADPPESSVMPVIADLPRINFLCCLDPAGCRPGHNRKILKDLVQTYERVIYLPLMPTYQMSCIVNPDNGFTLSHLLLRLTGNDVDIHELGIYLQPNPEGYLQFRPPDRSDDLVTCSSETMRLLILLIRKYIEKVFNSCAILIECTGLPFSTLRSVAVLCDSCQILLPEKDCYATLAARQEASQLMSDLPSGCKIISK
ncbi:MAG TPA: hypothetical protein DCM45_01405 [Clostridiales bacterium]|nr:hypothetical protein [Clostridiales bacterium]